MCHFKKTYHKWGTFQRFSLTCEIKVGTLVHPADSEEAGWRSPRRTSQLSTGQVISKRHKGTQTPEKPAFRPNQGGREKQPLSLTPQKLSKMWSEHRSFLNPLALQELSHDGPWSLFQTDHVSKTFLPQIYIAINVCMNPKTVFILILKACYDSQQFKMLIPSCQVCMKYTNCNTQLHTPHTQMSLTAKSSLL